MASPPLTTRLNCESTLAGTTIGLRDRITHPRMSVRNQVGYLCPPTLQSMRLAAIPAQTNASLFLHVLPVGLLHPNPACPSAYRVLFGAILVVGIRVCRGSEEPPQWTEGQRHWRHPRCCKLCSRCLRGAGLVLRVTAQELEVI